ncbi:hypothetical protein [Planctomycetes bacterium TBK1r]|uniref:Uncharacterized protein n=1 Tax=Stieleria magnilauensis TaxID=2527963 RepID=A0ABX5XJV7_9BACT|nr:hypothetical protein TBK1r_11900 [Planctomycetes bacterium TBK1r]
MRISMLATVCLFSAICCVGYSQHTTQKTATTGAPAKLFIGQSLADSKKALSDRQVKFGEGGFAFAKGNPDEGNLVVTIDNNHTYACVYYSKSQSVITKLDMVFFPSRRHGKAAESWLPATELQLNDDRSYCVTFAAPLIDDELREMKLGRPASQLPSLAK